MDSEPRFLFGRNWRRFAGKVTQTEVERAQSALQEMLEVADLAHVRFLDVGCGSGLSSLAARNLGAQVHAFDFDPDSVAASLALKKAHRPNDSAWVIEEGDITDPEYRKRLDTFNTVYSWGVLHHTGALITAMGAVTELVAPRGVLFIALYNDQGWVSRYWRWIKTTYVTHAWTRLPLIVFHAPYLIVLRYLVRLVRHRGALARGMSYRHDLADWLGGYPFEVISPEEVIEFYTHRGFALEKIRLVGRRHGCNEYVFRRST